MSWAWLFPGQGSQAVGMGKLLADASPAARRVFDEADDALGWSLSRLCFEGPEDQLTLTANAQPAIVTTSVAALEALREQVGALPAPAFAAGHSLGEYSALVAVGVLRLADAVRLVHLRGKFMQDAVPAGLGAMAAVMADEAEVEALCADAAQGESLAPANYNAPGQIVISGARTAIERAIALADERDLKVIPLKVSAPFHCSLMAPAADRMREALADVTLGEFAAPIVTNVEAAPNADAGRVIDLLVRQIASPVKWKQSVALMAASGVDRALELGSGRVLAGLVRRIERALTVTPVSDPATVSTAASLLAS